MRGMARRPVSDMHRTQDGRFKPLPGAKGFRSSEPRPVLPEASPAPPAARRPYRVPAPAGAVPGEGEEQ